MNYRCLGSSGLKVSELSLGAWGHLRRPGRSGRDHALCAGGLRTRGEFLRQRRYVLRVTRGGGGQGGESPAPDGPGALDQSLFPTGKDQRARPLAQAHLRTSIHGSLKRLGTDYVDLYFCHRFDPETPVRETVHVERSSAPGQGFVLGHLANDRKPN